MTPPAQYYLITKDELDEVFCFMNTGYNDIPEFTQDIEGEVLKRPAKESSDVLDELKGDRSALSLRLVQIYPQLNEDEKEYLFGCIEVILSRVELRQQQKERER